MALRITIKLNSNIKKLIAFPGVRLGMILVAYAAIISISLWLSFQLRFDFFVDPGFETYRDSIAVSILWIIPLKLCVLFIGRQFSGLLAFFSTPDLIRLFSSVTIGSALIVIPRLLNMDIMTPPRGVILIDFLVTLLMLSLIHI